MSGGLLRRESDRGTDVGSRCMPLPRWRVPECTNAPGPLRDGPHHRETMRSDVGDVHSTTLLRLAAVRTPK